MLKIEIKSTSVNRRSGVKEGRSWEMFEQVGYVHGMDGFDYPPRIVFTVDGPAQAYPAGFYELAPASFYSDKYGKLALGRLVLVAQRKVQAA